MSLPSTQDEIPTHAPTSPAAGEVAHASIPIGTVLAERYRLERVLGAGAMGSVYLVEHVQLRKKYALKLLHPDIASPEIIARFEREAVAAANIAHEGVTAATDFGRLTDGTFFLVLEYVAGRSLRTALAHDGAMVPSRALRVIRQVLRALGAAHAKGVVHRDIKPENVMLLDPDDASGAHSQARLAGEQDVVKVLDFGIAKLNESSAEGNGLTRAGTLYGTPTYMAPEQATGGAVDYRCDLYACGVMLYELISGEPPFNADGLLVLAQHVHDAPPPLHSPLGVPIGPKLRALVDALLAKEKEARPYDAAAAIGMIEDALAETKAAGAADLTGQLAAAPKAGRPSIRELFDRVVAELSERTGRPRSQVRTGLGVAGGVLLLLIVVVSISMANRAPAPDEIATFAPVHRHLLHVASDLSAPYASASVAPSGSAGVAPSATGTTATGGGTGTAAGSASASPSTSASVAGGKRNIGGKGFGKLKGLFH